MNEFLKSYSQKFKMYCEQYSLEPTKCLEFHIKYLFAIMGKEAKDKLLKEVSNDKVAGMLSEVYEWEYNDTKTFKINYSEYFKLHPEEVDKIVSMRVEYELMKGE